MPHRILVCFLLLAACATRGQGLRGLAETDNIVLTTITIACAPIVAGFAGRVLQILLARLEFHLTLQATLHFHQRARATPKRLRVVADRVCRLYESRLSSIASHIEKPKPPPNR